MATPAISERVYRGIVGLICAVGLTFLAGVTLLSFLANTLNFISMRPVDATVTKVAGSGPDSKRRITLTYQYTVDNRQYSGSHSWPKGRDGTARLTKLTVGKTVQVHYWPATPYKSMLLIGSDNVVGLLLLVCVFLLFFSSELQFAFTGRGWITINHANIIRKTNPAWVKNLMPVAAFSGGGHLFLSIIILPWRASMISGLVLVFCILPVAAWQSIKRSPPDSTASKG